MRLRKTSFWYDIFDLNDHRWWVYPFLVLVDHMYGRFIYLAGKYAEDIRGDYPALIPMDQAITNWKVLLKKASSGLWVPPGHTRAKFDYIR